MAILDRFVMRDDRAGKAETPSGLTRRVSSVPDSELLLWIDNTLAHIGQNSRRFLQDADEAAVQEAETATDALVALVGELRRRRAV